MSLLNIYGCICKECNQWHDMINDGVCINCRKKKREISDNG